MTRSSHKAILAVVFGGSILAASVAQQQGSDAASAGNEPISVTRFSNQKVIGFLGHPLGTVVRVTGFAVDGDDTRLKANMDKLLLRIETVNGKKLTKPALFDFQRADRDIVKPKPGGRFEYYVHEYGEFDGVVDPPKEYGIEREIVAHDGFNYRPRIEIHKSIKR